MTSTSVSYPAQAHVVKTFEKLLALLPETDRTKAHIALLSGEITPYRNDTDREILFRQESNFRYLSGCDVPGSYLLLVYKPGTGLEENPSSILFVPKIQEADLMWSVPPPDLLKARQIHDVNKVVHVDSLADEISTLLHAFPAPAAVWHTLPLSPAFPIIGESYLDSVREAGHTLSADHLLSALHRARLIKDAAEVALIRRANEISSRAHETVMRVLGAAVRGQIKAQSGTGAKRPLLPGEWLIEKEEEAEAIFVASCRREGAAHQAYLPIVAGGNRSSTLHYTCNCESLGPNKDVLRQSQTKELLPQVLLIDAGCEWECHASDITRTMPVGNGGKFTAEARAIYELVHEMQQLSFKAIRPGVHWDAVQLLCHRTLIRGFQRLGIFKTPNSPNSGSWNSEEAILASGISSAFFPHGLGHSLGMDVHDVPSASKPVVNDTIKRGVDMGPESLYTYLRLRLPLEEGMVVTVEPGCYFHPHLVAPVRDSKHIDIEVLKRYESMGGVRIEDVVLITGDGYENLTTVPSDVKWVEGVCSGEL